MEFKFFRKSYPKNAPSLRFVPIDKSVPIKDEESVLELAIRGRVPINYSCDGNGSCGTCRVYITKGLDKLPPRNELEGEWAVERGFADNERLACQIPPLDGLEVKVPEE